MKADLFVLYSLGAIAALFAYVFVGGLVVRAVEFFTSERVWTWTESGFEFSLRSVAIALWPLTIAVLAPAKALAIAYRLSQWRPRRKSALPGARVVRK